ncbi:MAG: hypothetical protein K1X83_12930 [Oligoflexia bacterium]|nr:hypothetical protein [Oligoflexia bacterium]
METRRIGDEDRDRSHGKLRELKVGERGVAPEFNGSLADLLVFETAPSLDKLSDRSIYLILDALRVPKRDAVRIPANLKIELEQAGLIESVADREYRRLANRVAMQPDVVKELGARRESAEALQSTVDALGEKLNSRWHRFWCFVWLGAEKLTQEREQLNQANLALAQARQAQESASQLNDELTGIQGRLSNFRKTSEGLLALTAAGRSFMQEFETASFKRLFAVESQFLRSVAGVWNPKTEQVEWETAYKGGIAGVWNPKTERVEWQTVYKHSVAGVWNPVTEQVEWEIAYKSGIAGVWNPKSKRVEWKTGYNSGVAGVWNPKTEKVEWKAEYRSGVAGVWNPETEKAVWIAVYNSGVAIVPRFSAAVGA